VNAVYFIDNFDVAKDGFSLSNTPKHIMPIFNTAFSL